MAGPGAGRDDGDVEAADADNSESTDGALAESGCGMDSGQRAPRGGTREQECRGELCGTVYLCSTRICARALSTCLACGARPPAGGGRAPHAKHAPGRRRSATVRRRGAGGVVGLACTHPIPRRAGRLYMLCYVINHNKMRFSVHVLERVTA